MSDEILFEKRGVAGFVRLNRPKALNALTTNMVDILAEQLALWAKDDDVHHTVVTSNSEKAFCAGGDVRAVYEAEKAGDTAVEKFFFDEYHLNYQIKTYPKPYISLIDGICMGGGAGISVHGSHRVGTEKTLFAMPETAIGLIPDVGATYFLARMPHHIGTYCAMSSGRLTQGDALKTGLLTHTTSHEQIEDLALALETSEDIDATLARFHSEPGAAPIMEHVELIEEIFSAASPLEVTERLKASSDEFAKDTLKGLLQKSPTSVSLTHEQMRRGVDLDFAECLRMEYRMVHTILRRTDFYEGVRAVLVDKDHDPKWSPETLEKIDPAVIRTYFDIPEGGDLPLSFES